MSEEEKNILNYSFEDLDINDKLLRGIYSYGFEKPSNIQYKSIPLIKKGSKTEGFRAFFLLFDVLAHII